LILFVITLAEICVKRQIFSDNREDLQIA